MAFTVCRRCCLGHAEIIADSVRFLVDLVLREINQVLAMCALSNEAWLLQ